MSLTYSDDIVEFPSQANGVDLRWAIFAVDVALVAGTALLKWHMSAAPLVLLLTPEGPGARTLWAVADSAFLTLLDNSSSVLEMELMLLSALTTRAATVGGSFGFSLERSRHSSHLRCGIR